MKGDLNRDPHNQPGGMHHKSNQRLQHVLATLWAEQAIEQAQAKVKEDRLASKTQRKP